MADDLPPNVARFFSGQGDDEPRAGQIDLIPDAEIERVMRARESTEGEYTLERLEARHPGKVAAIIQLRAEGLSIADVRAIVQVGPRTVMAVDSKYADAIVTARHKAASGFRQVSGMAIDELLARLADPKLAAKIPADKLAWIAGIATDKAELLTGRPTQRVERVEPMADDVFDQYVAGLASVPGETRLSAESPRAVKGGLAGPGDLVIECGDGDQDGADD